MFRYEERCDDLEYAFEADTIGGLVALMAAVRKTNNDLNAQEKKPQEPDQSEGVLLLKAKEAAVRSAKLSLQALEAYPKDGLLKNDEAWVRAIFATDAEEGALLPAASVAFAPEQIAEKNGGKKPYWKGE